MNFEFCGGILDACIYLNFGTLFAKPLLRDGLFGKDPKTEHKNGQNGVYDHLAEIVRSIDSKYTICKIVRIFKTRHSNKGSFLFSK